MKCSFCLFLLVWAKVLVFGGEIDKPSVTINAHDVTLNTATCSTDDVNRDKSRVQTIDLLRHPDRPYLARVSVRSKIERNDSYNTTLAARGGFNKTSTSIVSIGLLQTTTLDLRYENVTCRFGYLTKHGFESIRAQKREVRALKMELTVSQLPTGASVQIKLPTRAGAMKVFDSATQPINSLEFFNPDDLDDLTMYLWRPKGHDSAMSLTIITPLHSPLAAKAEQFKCEVKVGQESLECQRQSVPGESLGTQRAWLLPVVVPAAIVVVVVVVLVVIYCCCRGRNGSSNTDNIRNETAEMKEETHSAVPVPASDDVNLNENEADLSSLGLIDKNAEDMV